MTFQVIMVGSGGVGKSALTLQFMYDEVRFSWSERRFRNRTFSEVVQKLSVAV